jgi:hypothetical protein
MNKDPQIVAGIKAAAQSLGIDPVDLATIISYETGGTFNPTKAGPTTRWGTHRGFIQFGEPQAKQHGVDWDDPINSQLGPSGAIVSYLKSAGVKPGMSLLDVYSAVNAGAPGKYHLSDAASGGAPGTVLDKVTTQMKGHKAKAMALFDTEAEPPSPMGAGLGSFMNGQADIDARKAKLEPPAPAPAEFSAAPDTTEDPDSFPAPSTTPTKSPQDIYGEYLQALASINAKRRTPYSLNLATLDTVTYE